MKKLLKQTEMTAFGVRSGLIGGAKMMRYRILMVWGAGNSICDFVIHLFQYTFNINDEI